MDFLLGELFCGPGGMALGAGLAGQNPIPVQNAKGEIFTIKHLWGVDKDEDAIKTYRKNIVAKFGGQGICQDAFAFVQSMTSEQKRINALAFGFPCNDFSLVGDQTGFGGKFGTLYKAGIEVINLTNPLWFIAENVSGIHSADGGEAFKRILFDLKNAGHGYTLTANLYRFEEYGVPQFRHRFIIVGIRNDLNLKFLVPAPTTPLPEQYCTVEEALKNIPNNAPNMEFQKINKTVIERLMLTPPWKNAWFLDELYAMSSLERRIVLKKLPWYNDVFANMSDVNISNMLCRSMLHCKSARMSHIYRRLDAKKPSYTITGSGGGGTHVYHWNEHRSLNNRERARIQTFPDDFEFVGTSEKVRKQIGMAVPTKAAELIFIHILKTFAGEKYATSDTEIVFDKNDIITKKSITVPTRNAFIKKITELNLANEFFDRGVNRLYDLRFFENKLYYKIKKSESCISIDVLYDSLCLFGKNDFLSERSLMQSFSKEIPDVLSAFLVLSILHKMRFGIIEQPYLKSDLRVLKPRKR